MVGVCGRLRPKGSNPLRRRSGCGLRFWAFVWGDVCSQYDGEMSKLDAIASVDVCIDSNELKDVEAALRAIGFEGSVVPDIHFRSMGEVPWVLMLSMPVTAFLTGFFGAAGAEAWKSLKSFVVRVQRARPHRRGSIEFLPEDSPRLTIPEGLPDEAYKALLDLDFSSFKNSTLIWWDTGRQKWIDD